MRAFCLIRISPHYRHDAFMDGLKAVGYEVHQRTLRDMGPGDVLVTWNRYGHNHQLALAAKKAGARVLVAENGYLGSVDGKQYYAIAEDYHNGAGASPLSDKWIHGVELQPWRYDGSEVVILAQRGIGSPNVAQPQNWVTQTRQGFPCRVREHPGTGRCVPLEDDLRNARAVVTWASGAAIKAICMGIPCHYGLHSWIARDAALPLKDMDLCPPRRSGRGAMLKRIAGAQWTVEEIAKGDPFRVLLHGAGVEPWAQKS